MKSVLLKSRKKMMKICLETTDDDRCMAFGRGALSTSYMYKLRVEVIIVAENLKSSSVPYTVCIYS